jgi:thiol-disulfide isomerase/thioredoxin
MTRATPPCAPVPRIWLAAMCLALASSHAVLAQEEPKNLIMHAAPKQVAAIEFQDDHGRTRSVADFRGKVVLLNIWATWCGPCRKEMPGLDRLQAVLGGGDFEVVPLSIDRTGIAAVRGFYAEVGVRHLAMYADASGSAVRKLDTLGVPTTVLIGRDGREIGRLTGPAEWDAPATIEFMKRIIAQPSRTTRADAGPDRSHDEPGTLTRGLNWFKAMFGM